MVDHALESRINRDFHYKFHFVRKIDSRSKEARRRERRKESERREQVYTGQYYRAIPSEMPRLGLLGMSHCKQWTMRLLLLHNGRSLTRSRPYVASSPPPPHQHLRRSHEHHLRRGYKFTSLPSSFREISNRFKDQQRSRNTSPINDGNLLQLRSSTFGINLQSIAFNQQ